MAGDFKRVRWTGAIQSCNLLLETNEGPGHAGAEDAPRPVVLTKCTKRTWCLGRRLPNFKRATVSDLPCSSRYCARSRLEEVAVFLPPRIHG